MIEWRLQKEVNESRWTMIIYDLEFQELHHQDCLDAS